MPAKKEEKPNIDELKKSTSNFITRTDAFKKLCNHVFKICDSKGSGTINATELYAGVLLVHLNLAKYAGPAACYPAPRPIVDQLFSACDDDNSGKVDGKEFEDIMIITAASISSRILAYYACIIVLVPYLAKLVLKFLDLLRMGEGIEKIDELWDANSPDWLNSIMKLIPSSFWLGFPETIINLAFFFIVIPKIFDKIDSTGYKVATKAD